MIVNHEVKECVSLYIGFEKKCLPSEGRVYPEPEVNNGGCPEGYKHTDKYFGEKYMNISSMTVTTSHNGFSCFEYL